MQLKEFQQETIRKSVSNIYELLEESSRRFARGINTPAKFILQSCTGSGKTIMMAEILRELKERDLSDKYVFFWAAPNKLHTQSLKKLSNILSDTEYKLVDIEMIEPGELVENTVLFANWEKLFKISNKDIPEKGIEVGDFTNRLVRKGEDGRNLQDILDETRNAGLKVILIADESHQTFMGANSQMFINTVIRPSLIIEASATPKLNSDGLSTDMYRLIKTETQDVIDSGLIKKQILLNADIEEAAEELNRDAIETVVVAGLRKRAELEQRYEELGKNIKPLMLIQLPNDKDENLSELDTKVKAFVEDILSDHDYEFVNQNLGIWLSGEKENLDHITDFDNKVDVLIFKQAVALGWDCPRAQVLVMLRDIKSEAFQIQTVGRVLRMPEAEHYGDDLLDSAYVYTNTGREVKIDPNDKDAKNLIKYQTSLLKAGIENVILPDSIYVHRTDYGDLKANFKPVLESEFNAYFGISESDSATERNVKLGVKLEIIPEKLMTPVISDYVIKNVDDIHEKDEIKTINLSMNEANIERVFRDVLRGYCGKFKSFVRSESVLKGTLKPWFKRANLTWDVVQKIFTCSQANQYVFSEIFERALDRYDSVNADEMRERRQRADEMFDFSIPTKDMFTGKYTVQNVQKCAIVPYFRFDNAPQTEISFEDYLDKLDSVEYWYKNGEKMKQYFAVKYYELNENAKGVGKAFYPDYIVKFKDGRIGIFDTKSGITASDKYARQKAEALQRYISEHGNLKLFGGIINVVGGRFYINQSMNYKFGDGRSGEWKLLSL